VTTVAGIVAVLDVTGLLSPAEGLQRHHNLHEPDILRRIEAASPFAMQADAA
jgi:hypothetical protein